MRCKQATGKATVPFGGISIILVGDVAQLPPIGDKVLYHTKPCGDLETEGFYVYHKFGRVIKLSVNQRASGDDNSQNLFRELQINLRNGESTMQDWNMLLSRTPPKVSNLQTFEKHAVKISYGNQQVAKENCERLKNLGQPIIPIDAKHNNKTAAKLPADDMGALCPKLLLSKHTKVMLTRNLWTEAGLCNGSMGIVKDIIYKELQLLYSSMKVTQDQVVVMCPTVFQFLL